MRIIYFHYPFLSPISSKAAEYAECVGEQGSEHFWSFLEAIYDNQRGLSPEILDTFVTGLDLDVNQVFECVDSGKHIATWENDLEYGRSLGVQATPTIFIAYIDQDGQVVGLQFRGARSFEEMSEALDAILEEIGA